MPLGSDDMARLAHLARLEFDPAESAALLAQMNDFFALVEKMRAVDTTGVEPLAHPLAAVADIRLRLRADCVSEPDESQANLRNAPLAAGGLFLVPKVIE